MPLVSINHKPWKIYTLSSELTGEVRYVGVTTNAKVRLSLHLSRARNNKTKTHKDNWIRSLLASNINVIMTEIESGQGPTWQEREQYWIAHYRGTGADLTNATDGGDGTIGRTLSDEHKAQISTKSKERRDSPETRMKKSMALKGRSTGPLSEETKKKLSAAHKGRVKSEQEILNISMASKNAIANGTKIMPVALGSKRSSDVRNKISIANKGRVQSQEEIEKRKLTIKTKRENGTLVARKLSPGERQVISERKRQWWIRWHEERKRSNNS